MRKVVSFSITGLVFPQGESLTQTPAHIEPAARGSSEMIKILMLPVGTYIVP